VKSQGPNTAASVRQRLLNLSKERGFILDEVMQRFAIARLLHRLEAAGLGEEFVLKGATLFTIWQGEPHRTTRDVDLLGRGSPSIERLVEVFRKVAETATVEPDGLIFDPASVIGARIGEEREHEGVRIKLLALLANARINLQIDVGFGDVVLPAPELVELPALLDFQPTRLRAYPKEAVVAEKLHAMVLLGETNTRLKDFYDLWTLAQGHRFEGARLTEAILGTFTRRRTALPNGTPVALTPLWTQNPVRLVQWRGFLNKATVRIAPPDLPEMAQVLVGFLRPPLNAAATFSEFSQTWLPGGPWR
jgi:predicted nucleotidyltransferase component of viral defense system